jgi:hypothetical protein
VDEAEELGPERHEALQKQMAEVVAAAKAKRPAAAPPPRAPPPAKKARPAAKAKPPPPQQLSDEELRAMSTAQLAKMGNVRLKEALRVWRELMGGNQAALAQRVLAWLAKTPAVRVTPGEPVTLGAPAALSAGGGAPVAPAAAQAQL